MSSHPERELLFSITKADFEFDFFRCGGAGGQHRDKTSNGARCRHPLSGAVGESTMYREQSRNKVAAFNRMANSSLFQSWVRKRAAEFGIDRQELLRKVERMMAPENIKIEYGRSFE